MTNVYQFKRIRCSFRRIHSFAYWPLHREHYLIQSKISTIEQNREVLIYSKIVKLFGFYVRFDVFSSMKTEMSAIYYTEYCLALLYFQSACSKGLTFFKQQQPYMDHVWVFFTALSYWSILWGTFVSVRTQCNPDINEYWFEKKTFGGIIVISLIKKMKNTGK